MSAKTSAPFASRILSIAVTATVGVAALPAAPASAAEALSLVVAPAKEAPTTNGKTVALMRFTGDPMSTELRVDMQSALTEAGYTVTTVALDVADAAKRIKCKEDASSDACLEALGKWLNNSPKTAADFIVFGSVEAGPQKQAEVVVYAIADNRRVKTLRPMLGAGDLILPIVLGGAMGRALDEHREPPEAASQEELNLIATLDEPEKTPEEIAAEEKAIADAEAAAEEEAAGVAATLEDVEVDLKADFKDFCREGKRKKRESRDDPKDLSPKCSRGAFWGYWQPRAWVALTLTSGAAIGTIAFYSAALAARGPYKDAVSAVDAYTGDLGGDPSQDPTLADDNQYVVLATEVSSTGSTMRRRAVFGDAFLGGTAVLGGVLAIIIWQDRRDAKGFLKQEKGLRAVSDVMVAPMLTRDTKGVGASFRF
ncbi:MAG: hypothetical protein KUG77_13690 [Nannocystaceae bacterium]|nr:hypothetical protein [Nannocystaceae bacterium]